jgi:hypothetical protein
MTTNRTVIADLTIEPAACIPPDATIEQAARVLVATWGAKSRSTAFRIALHLDTTR